MQQVKAVSLGLDLATHGTSLVLLSPLVDARLAIGMEAGKHLLNLIVKTDAAQISIVGVNTSQSILLYLLLLLLPI